MSEVRTGSEGMTFKIPLGEDHSAKGPPLIRFLYTNWNGEHHEYVIEPESIEFAPYDKGGSRAGLRGSQAVWVLHGDLVTRDGDTRADMDTRRRTFIMSEIVEPEILNDR